jgi:hypothetical protein
MESIPAGGVETGAVAATGGGVAETPVVTGEPLSLPPHPVVSAAITRRNDFLFILLPRLREREREAPICPAGSYRVNRLGAELDASPRHRPKREVVDLTEVLIFYRSIVLRAVLAEAVRFELTKGVNPCRFSRPVP